ncbi:SapC family protein [Ruegeria profundi]|uniref:SapC family protein n=1 Tax=Ruegeria profundi TaxID=1685378 RepID=UPI00299F266E|nr:SapC family protein [Ruegeria profundi]
MGNNMAQNGHVPVTFTRHGLMYWRRFTSYEFAMDRTDCAIVLQEVLQAASAFPIFFKKDQAGFEPHVILSFLANMPTPFVSRDGRWMAAYVPSDLRCYPFRAEPVGRDSSDSKSMFRLCVDEASGLVSNDPNDETFFDKTGALSPALQEVQAFLGARAAAREATQALCQMVDKLGLFEPLAAYDGIDLAPGTFAVSAQRLSTLKQAEKLRLVESGALQLIHAHQVSLAHCRWIAQAQQQLRQEKSQGKYTKNLEISSFLHAMANAPTDDFLGTNGV